MSVIRAPDTLSFCKHLGFCRQTIGVSDTLAVDVIDILLIELLLRPEAHAMRLMFRIRHVTRISVQRATDQSLCATKQTLQIRHKV